MLGAPPYFGSGCLGVLVTLGKWQMQVRAQLARSIRGREWLRCCPRTCCVLFCLSALSSWWNKCSGFIFQEAQNVLSQ